MKTIGNMAKYSGGGVLKNVLYEGDTASDSKKLDGKSAEYYAKKTEVDAAQSKADAALPKANGRVTGTLAPAVSKGANLGSESVPWGYVNASEIYARGGRLISINPANSADYLAIGYANHMIQNSQTGDAMKLCSNAGVWIRDTGNAAWTYINAAAFNQQSSVRFKHILGTMSRERARKALGLDLIKFRYKAEYDNSGKIYYGIKAEQAEELELFDMLTYDMDGLPFGVDYAKLTPYLAGIAKDHDARVEKLEIENASLKALLVSKGVCTQEEIDELEARNV